MKAVEFFQTTDSGQDSLGFVIISDSGAVDILSYTVPFIQDLLSTTLLEVGDDVFSPDDGLEYMKNLSVQFSGSRIRASEIKNVDQKTLDDFLATLPY